MAYSRHAYIFSASVAFVPHPFQRGVWYRVHPCVLLVACPSPGCGAGEHQLCRQFKQYPVHYTHYQRRRAMKGKSAPSPSVVMLRKDWRTYR